MMSFTVSCLLGALVTAGCSMPSNQSVTGPTGILAQAEEAYAAQTIAEWAEHGDQLVSFTVVREERVNPGAEEKAAGEGLIGRNVVVRASRPYWSRPGASTPVEEMVLAAGGWVFHGVNEVPLRSPDCPWLIVGHSYLALVNQMPSGGGAPWNILSCHAIMAYDGDRIGHGEQFDGALEGTRAQFTDGKATDVATELAKVATQGR